MPPLWRNSPGCHGDITPDSQDGDLRQPEVKADVQQTSYQHEIVAKELHNTITRLFQT